MSVPKKFLKRKKRVRSLVTVKAYILTIKIIQGCHLGHNFARHNFPLTFIYLYEVNFLHKENFLYNMKNETFKPFKQVISKFITCLVKLYINFEGKGNYVKSVKMLKMVAAPPMGDKI